MKKLLFSLGILLVAILLWYFWNNYGYILSEEKCNDIAGAYYNEKDNSCYCSPGYLWNDSRTECIAYDGRPNQ